MNCSSAEELEQYLAGQEALGRWLVQAVEQDLEVWLVFACAPQIGDAAAATPPPSSVSTILPGSLGPAAE